MNRQFIERLLSNWAKLFLEHEEYLTELDSIGGDGDLGIVMKDGFQAIQSYVKEIPDEDIGLIFYKIGKKFNEVASSSMGTLLSFGFVNIGKQLKNKDTLCSADFLIIVGAMADGVRTLGKAKENEKTFLDSIYPALYSMQKNSDKTDVEMMGQALMAAEIGVSNAKEMLAVHGRLAFRGEQSKGIVDPGSVVGKLWIEGILLTVKEKYHVE